MKQLNAKQIEELKQFDTPTVCNAVERFNLRGKTEGFMNPSIKSVFPDRPPLVGYACTAKISAAQPPTAEQKELLFAYYQQVKATPVPPIAVIQDVDETPVGSFWGEVQATVHKALGCMGVITNGGVRDLDEVRDLGFTYFSSCVLVSHGFIHVESVNVPVTFGGVTVNPGDLLHADKHGVLVIPGAIAHELADACRLTQDAELPMLNGCRSVPDGQVTIEQLKGWRSEMEALRSKKQ